MGSLILDADALTAAVNGEEVPVTTREFNILYKLLSYPNHTFSRSQLMDEFWGSGERHRPAGGGCVYTKLRVKFSTCPGL